MCRCLNCDSRFFKTLETRILSTPNTSSSSEASTITFMMKKRCKRCKYKYFYRKDLPENITKAISYDLWAQGTRVASTTLSTRGHVFASDYSKKISREAEKTIPYLSRLANLEKGSSTHG